jgi:hypothetical protein
MRAKVLTKDAEKKALINVLSNRNWPLMFFYEEEPGASVLHERVGEFITVVHPPYDYETLEKWLYLGNWQAIFPANKDYEPFNTFKAKAWEIEKRMSDAKLRLIIDSFHDNIDWNVIQET